MTDWESDPELKALREDFVRSFESRRQALVALLAEIQRAGSASVKGDQGPAFELLALAHSLAGTAATYGFVTVGDSSGELEDLLLSKKEVPVSRVIALGSRLERLLAKPDR